MKVNYSNISFCFFLIICIMALSCQSWAGHTFGNFRHLAGHAVIYNKTGVDFKIKAQYGYNNTARTQSWLLDCPSDKSSGSIYWEVFKKKYSYEDTYRMNNISLYIKNKGGKEDKEAVFSCPVSTLNLGVFMMANIKNCAGLYAADSDGKPFELLVSSDCDKSKKHVVCKIIIQQPYRM